LTKRTFYRSIQTCDPIIFSEQNIKSSFQVTGLIAYNPQHVLLLLTVTKTPSPPPPGTSHGAAPQWTSETPHTVAQIEQQAQLVQNLLQCQSQSPSNQAISQLIKGCQIAMNSAVILAEENKKLCMENQQRKQKQQYCRQYIAHGGVLQAQQGQFLVKGGENGSGDGIQDQEVIVREQALPTCSGCVVFKVIRLIDVPIRN
jgi:hypothetical protein